MSNSKSSPKTTTTTSDLRTTNTLNAGLEGDISDAMVAAGNYGDTTFSSTQFTDNSDRSFTDSSDNSFKVNLSDYSNRSTNDYSDRSFTDSSDNSLKVNLSDYSNRSTNDYSDRSSSWSDYSDRSFTDTSDNSLNVQMSDTSNRSTNDYSDRSSSWSDYSDRSFTDTSDNSLNVQMSDTSNRSTNDYSNRSTTDNSDRSFTDTSTTDNSFRADFNDSSNRSVDNSVTNITDGGAFALVRDMGGDVIETLGESQTEALGTVNKVVSSSYDFVSNSQDSLFSAVGGLVEKALDASNNIAQQSLQGAMQIKAGQTITEPVNQTVREVVGAVTKVAFVGGAIYLGSKFLGGK